MGDILRQSLYAHMPIIRDIVYGAAARGVPVAAFCKKLNIDVADLDNSEKRADFETSCKAWEMALKMTGDPQLGLHIGQSSNPSIMGLVGYLMQNSRTLLEAFRQVSEHGRIATNMFEYRVIEKKDNVILQYTPVAVWRQLYPRGAKQALDQAMAGTLNVFYLLSGKKIRPAATTANQLIFTRQDLLTPVLRPDRSLLAAFLKIAREKRKGNTLAGQIKGIILNDFNGVVPPVEVVASRLNMTVRSLQRRLSAENTSFRRISGQIVKEVGRKLRKADHKVADIARILGYSSPRAFRRAYKAG